jgi:hypothetical protein
MCTNDESSAVETFAWLMKEGIGAKVDAALVEGKTERYKAFWEALVMIENYYPNERNNYCMDIIGNEVHCREEGGT